MSHTKLSDNDPKLPARNDFPSLSHENLHGGGKKGFSPFNGNNNNINNGHRGMDNNKARFGAPPPKRQQVPFSGAPPVSGLAAQMAGRREAKAAVGDSVFSPPTVVAPRPSPRIRLRGSSLLQTFPSDESVNALYSTYRSRALQLGAARNACLSRAADAWRRGDGAAAKRFSREGHELNAKMGAEATEAATKLVRERAHVAESILHGRGSTCGAGLGVVLGVAGKEVGEEMAKLTAEERTEAALDLHGLHANEATEVLEEFLIAVSNKYRFIVLSVENT